MARIQTKDYTVAKTTKIENAFAVRFGYKTTLENGSPNPQTKAQFVAEQIEKFIAQNVSEQTKVDRWEEIKAAVETEVASF